MSSTGLFFIHFTSRSAWDDRLTEAPPKAAPHYTDRESSEGADKDWVN